MVVVLVICVLVGIMLYYLLSPKKRREREKQKKKETIHQKSIAWKAHPLFPQIVDSCEKEIEKKLNGLKASGLGRTVAKWIPALYTGGHMVMNFRQA